MGDWTQLEAEIADWIRHDPEESTRAELSQLLAAASAGTELSQAARAELASRFASPLSFGTAGLRGQMGAGPGRMNAAVVLRATYGLVSTIKAELGADFRVAVGFDGRHHSADYARAAAGVIAAAGGQAILMDKMGPTPLLAFAMSYFDCDAGIMVTASHNPAPDNGYKVYLGGRLVTDAGRGAQLVSPWDARIFAAIMAAPPADQVPVAAAGWQHFGPDIVQAYVQGAAQQASGPNRALKLVLTSMHGVGAELCEAALQAAGFTQVHPVAAQRDPDPDFPTVPFPNPEEAGALDLAMNLGEELGADLIVANDPDADRCSVAIPDPELPAGWRQLTGDEAGTILGRAAVAQAGGSTGQAVCRSLVSGSLLDKIAQAHGVTPLVSLTGFKWIARTPGMIFGYEEALGNCCDPQRVRDKDGISATVRFAQIVADLRAQGRSVDDLLDDFALEYGLHVTSPLTFRVADLSLIQQGMARLRAAGLATLGGEAVTFSLDLSTNQISEAAASSVPASWDNLHLLPPTDALFFGTSSGTRVVVRPSGTEPKLKCYIELVTQLAGESREAARLQLAPARADSAARLETIKQELTAALGF